MSERRCNNRSLKIFICHLEEDFAVIIAGCRLAKLIPWDGIEKEYAKKFADSGMGAPAKAARIAVGALIIQQKLGLTDEETVEQIRENPYLQYFIGNEEYRDEKAFEASMMVHFRKRLKLEELSGMNELIHEGYRKEEKGTKEKDKEDKGGTQGGTQNRGKLM